MFLSQNEDVTVITANRRLSRRLQVRHAKLQRDHGRLAWSTPDFLPWMAWCQRTLAQLANSNQLILINSLQQKWLWTDIINQDEQHVLRIDSIVDQIMSSYLRCKQWRIPVSFPDDFYPDEDAQAFQKWVKHYERIKQEKAYLDDASLPDYIAMHLDTSTPLKKKLIFHGFEQFNPQQQVLIKALKHHTDVSIYRFDEARSHSISLQKYADHQSEMLAATNWAKERLADDACIGIVSPNMRGIRDELDHICTTVLSPDDALILDAPHRPYHSIYSSKPLMDYPLIATAMSLLELIQGEISLNALNVLLHSPFIADSERDLNTRSQFYLSLRSYNQQKFDLATLQELEKQIKPGVYCQRFMQLLKHANEIHQTYSESVYPPRQWLVYFSSYLRQWSWPMGDRVLTSYEYQIFQAWEDTLIIFSSLNEIADQIDFATALGTLQKLLSTRQFQIDDGHKIVELSNLDDVTGMDFDYLWVMGMNDQNWPQKHEADCLIPFELQLKYGVIDADPSLQLERAKQMTKRLATSAKEIVFSYFAYEDGREFSPSALLNQFTLIDHTQTPSIPSVAALIQNDSKIEYFDDPPISLSDEISYRSSLFNDQRDCSFRAFAIHCLGTYKEPDIDIDIDPLTYGRILHKILENIWSELQDHHRLSVLTVEEKQTLVKSHVWSVLNYQLRHRGNMNKRFIKLKAEQIIQIVESWLECEQSRQPFRVVERESFYQKNLYGLNFKLRPDRIDQLADGSHVVVDYKTSKHKQKDIETNFQLPLYMFTHGKQISTIALASLHPETIKFFQAPDDILFSTPSEIETQTASFQPQREVYAETMKKLASTFRSGAPVAMPDSPEICRRCYLHGLCRIYDDQELS